MNPMCKLPPMAGLHLLSTPECIFNPVLSEFQQRDRNSSQRAKSVPIIVACPEQSENPTCHAMKNKRMG